MQWFLPLRWNGRPQRVDIKPNARILILRLSALGDVILTLPVASALRQEFPQAHIAWLVEQRNRPILEGHPAIDEIITVPRRWYRSWQVLTALRTTLKQKRFDLVLDVQSLSKSAVLGWLSAAPIRLGFAPPQGREIAPFLATHRVKASGTHVVEIFLSLLRPLGVENPPVIFQIGEHPAEADWACRTLQELGLGEGFAVINPGAAWESKRWPPERFAAVTRFLCSHLHRPVLVLWGNAAERSVAERIVKSAEAGARLAPPTNLREMAALLRRAGLMISSDTGPLHLAAALGVPCVGLYGPTSPERNGPYGPGHISLQARRYTGRHPRKAGTEFIEAISVDLVCQACQRLLARKNVA